jgi:ATP-binding cassette subfamily C protein CydD
MNLDKRLLRQVRTARVALALTITLGFLGGLVMVLQARLLSQVVGRVFLGGGTLHDVQPGLLILLTLALVRAALTWGGEVAAQRVAGRVKSQLREYLSAHLLALGPAFARDERSGELSNTITEGVEALDAYLSQYLPQLALAALVPLTILTFVFPLDLLSGLVLLLTAPLIPLFMVLIGSVTAALTRRQWTALSRMSAHFLDVLQGLTTLKLLGRSREQLQTIAQVSDRFRQTTMGVLRVAFLSALVLELVATISTAVVAVEVGLRLLYGRLAFEQAFFVLLLAPEFYLPLRLLGSRFHAGTSGLAAAQRIFEILDQGRWTPTGDEGKPQARPVSGAIQPIYQSTRPRGVPSTFHIRFQDVHYAYDGGERPALKGVSFQIMAGQRVALVGPSGAGKSTIAQLLLRFIEPQRGAITVDGIRLGDLERSAWRVQVAWVPQNPYLFHASVADNIRLARPDASLEQVIQAARQAHAHAFIQALPQGYDTLIGERGARLSGGEAQRVALARAFLKDAPLLILDEATAHLDPGHQALIQEAITRLLRSRTALIIAHRLRAVYDADQILVLAGGRVTEAGSHAALLEQGGLYQRLVAAYEGSV